MVQSESPIGTRPARDPAEQPRGRPARSIVGVLQGFGALAVALFAGTKRAGKAAGVETILGATMLGATVAPVVLAGVHVFTRWPLHLLDAVEVGAGAGAALGTALNLFSMALEDHAKTKRRSRFGDN